MFEGVCEVTVAAVQRADPFALAAALAPVSEDALMAMSADEAECVVAATQRVANAMAARQAVAVDRYTEHIAEEIARYTPGQAGSGQVISDTAAMLAPILRIAPRTMAARVAAAQWGGVLARTSDLAWAGDLEAYRVAAITRAGMTLGVDDVLEFEARLYERDVVAMAASRVGDRAVRIAHRLAARTPDPAAVLPRWVRLQGAEHAGTTRWNALLPTDRSQRMWAAITTLAGEYQRANPALSMAQARADALTDLLLGNAQVATEVTVVLPAEHAPYQHEDPFDDTSGRVTPEPPVRCRPLGSVGSVGAAWADIHWVERLLWDASPVESRIGNQVSRCARVDVNPFLGRDPTGEHVWFVPGPVLAPGLGALIPTHLTAILTDPDLRVRLARAHPDTGAVTTLDERAYRPGAALARLVRARDGTCRFPGCNTPASSCHLDHVIRYPDGPTTVANLQTLCATHHGFKHHANWTVTMTPTGTCTWTAPNGRTHTTHPHAIHDHAA